MEGKKTGIMQHKAAYVAIIVAVVAVLAIVAYAAASSSSPAVVKSGDIVSVYYTGSFTNGTVFNSNVGKAPFNFTVGSNEVIPGFQNAIIGMRVGENKTVTLPPSEAYGPVNNSLIISVPLSEFGNKTVQTGMVVTTQTGAQGIVTNVTTSNAIVDFNPLLAGKTLVFQIEVVKIKSG